MATVHVGSQRGSALKSLGFNLTLNALCPFLLYRNLQPHYPATSIVPLLYATIFPVIGLCLSLVRKRAIDAIAFVAMAEITIHIVVTLLSRNVRIALVVRSLDGALIGLVLIVSALIGHPILFLIAKQIVASRGPDQTKALSKAIEDNGANTFFIATLVWGICLVAMSAVHVALALHLPPAEFLLASPLLGVATVIALLVWTGLYVTTRSR